MIGVLIAVLVVAAAWTTRSGPGRHERPQTFRLPRTGRGYQPRHQAHGRHETTGPAKAVKAVTA